MLAARAHRAFCASLAGRWPHFANDVWGITASDSPKGYVVWGGPPEIGPLDGSLVPSAPAGSLPFLPAESIRCLRTFRDPYGALAWTRYGFADAFNPATGWVGPDVIGLGCGDGHKDVRLVQHLLAGPDSPAVRLFLLDLSQPLLAHAFRTATLALPEHGILELTQ